MKCPLNNITIIFVTGKVLKDSDYWKAGDTMSGFFSATHGPGLNYGFWNYANSSATAGGGGYSKTGVLLAEVINKQFGTSYRNSGEGEEYTIRNMQRDGFTVTRMYEVGR